LLSLGIYGERQEDRKEIERTGERKTYMGHPLS
jgi:hypothetical protein